MGLFTVTRKLLLLWGGSTFVAIAIVGGIFAYSMNTYYGEVADQKIRDGLNEVRGYLVGQEDRLGVILREFAKRADVYSAISVVSKYQKIDNEQLLALGAEKKKLAAYLGELGSISNYYYLALYDAEGGLTAYHYEKADLARGLEKIGFVTYENAIPVFVESDRATGDFSKVAHLPSILSQSAPEERPTHVKAFLGASDAGLLMTLHAPIERVGKSGAVEYLGSITVVDVIDQPVLGQISKRIGSELNYIGLNIDAQSALLGWDASAPDLLRGNGEYRALEDNNGVSAQVTVLLDDGQKVGISIHTDKGLLMAELAAFEASVIWGLLIIIAVMTPIGFYFIDRIIRRPIQALMAGVAAVAEGRNAGVIRVKARDEFGTLAKSFTDMSATIRAREVDLMHHQEILEKTVSDRTEKLRETEAKTRQIVNSAVDGIVTTDEKGMIISFNTSAEKIFGYSVIEVVGKNVSLLMPTHQAARHDEYMARYVAGGEAKVVGMGRELVALRKDGTSFLADFSISDFRHGDTVTFVGIIRDITERKDAEYKLQSTLEELQNTQDELVQAEKMASLGGLVAGVAHEINTPIGVGVTAATHLKEQAERLAGVFASGALKKSDFQSFIDTAIQSTGMISTNLNRASDLIKSFKQVAVDQSSEEKRTINLLDYIDEVLVSLNPQLKRTAHSVAVEGDRDIYIETYPGALAQVITNLLMNSIIHAYDDGEAGHIKIQAEKNSAAVSLLYVDDGKGMDDDVSAKIFEPFFTTKRGSGGSGLGMHILFNQVTQTLGGNIQMHSKPGRGTAFDITIPYKADALQKGEQS